MCRNIKPLFNFEPAATKQEIDDAALQFVRKISGFRIPSKANEDAMDLAVKEISITVQKLLGSLQTSSEKRSREVEMLKAHERALKRFGK